MHRRTSALLVLAILLAALVAGTALSAISGLVHRDADDARRPGIRVVTMLCPPLNFFVVPRNR